MAGRRNLNSRGDEPIGEGEFAALMDQAGPFGVAPAIAVAVSGGADSMALAVLTDRWLKEFARPARSRDEAAPTAPIVALTVDHGLRAESRDEAHRVADWLERRGIEHHILTWHGVKPRSGIQAAARQARYRLLGDWCIEHGIGHLALAHHLEDQAETFMLRLGRGSGVDGLAAMARIVDDGPVRLVRPLLAIPKARMRATLRAMGQDWIDDPSNADHSFARVRMRNALPALASEGLTPDRLAATAARMMRARRALEWATRQLLDECSEIHPSGYARFDSEALMRVPQEISLRALAALLMKVGGAMYRPRLERLERVHDAIRDQKIGRGRTLSGCVIRPCPRRFARDSGDYLICREPSSVEGARVVRPGSSLRWDGRFQIHLDADAAGEDEGMIEVAALRSDGWSEIRKTAAFGHSPGLPSGHVLTVPAFRVDGALIAVPHLGYVRPGWENWFGRFQVRFAPLSMAGAEKT
ncbi:MAG: tRNA lysidine(34) synthetase TilS [Sphingomonadales bacterium]